MLISSGSRVSHDLPENSLCDMVQNGLFVTCPIDPPANHQLFHGVKGANGITYEPAIPIGDVDCRKWLFTWEGVGQWVTPQYLPTCEYWVAIPMRKSR